MEENKENSAPTWAEFKPPVMTTPFANGGSLNIPESTDNSTDLSQGFQAPTPSADPVVDLPAPDPVVADPPEPVDPMPAPTPKVTPAPEPEVPTETASATPGTTTPVETPTEASLPEVTPPAPTEPVTPPSVAGEPPKAMPVVAALVSVALIIGGGYFYLSSNQANLEQSTVAGTATRQENLEILKSSLGPESWEKNYSSDLLASERGGLEFLITDPEGAEDSSTSVDLSSLRVTIGKVEAHLDNQSVVATSANATQSASKAVDRWETLRLNQNRTVDLMSLRGQGGAVVSLGVTYLAAGSYNQLRVYITAVEAQTSSGEKVVADLTESNAILSLNKPFSVTTTGSVKLTLDFDAPAMIEKTDSGYSFKTVLKRVLLGDKEI